MKNNLGYSSVLYGYSLTSKERKKTMYLSISMYSHPFLYCNSLPQSVIHFVGSTVPSTYLPTHRYDTSGTSGVSSTRLISMEGFINLYGQLDVWDCIRGILPYIQLPCLLYGAH